MRSFLAVTCGDATARLWAASATGIEKERRLTGHRGAVQCLDFSPTTGELATGASDSEIRFWNPQTGQQVGGWTIDHPPMSLSYHADGRVLVWSTLPSYGFRLRSVGTDDRGGRSTAFRSRLDCALRSRSRRLAAERLGRWHA